MIRHDLFCERKCFNFIASQTQPFYVQWCLSRSTKKDPHVIRRNQQKAYGKSKWVSINKKRAQLVMISGVNITRSGCYNFSFLCSAPTSPIFSISRSWYKMRTLKCLVKNLETKFKNYFETLRIKSGVFLNSLVSAMRKKNEVFSNFEKKFEFFEKLKKNFVFCIRQC